LNYSITQKTRFDDGDSSSQHLQTDINKLILEYKIYNYFIILEAQKMNISTFQGLLYESPPIREIHHIPQELLGDLQKTLSTIH
jgi:hypothetical protein